MKRIDEIIYEARKKNASDIHLTYGQGPVYRIFGNVEQGVSSFPGERSDELILSIISGEQEKKLKSGHDVDFCYTLPGGLRHRVNVYVQQGHYTATIRMLNAEIPTIDELRLPKVLKMFAGLPRGLVLVTGATGSGKSTTLAAMIDYVNENKKGHIITIEDPVEYMHRHKNCIIHQREVEQVLPA